MYYKKIVYIYIYIYIYILVTIVVECLLCIQDVPGSNLFIGYDFFYKYNYDTANILYRLITFI